MIHIELNFTCLIKVLETIKLSANKWLELIILLMFDKKLLKHFTVSKNIWSYITFKNKVIWNCSLTNHIYIYIYNIYINDLVLDTSKRWISHRTINYQPTIQFRLVPGKKSTSRIPQSLSSGNCVWQMKSWFSWSGIVFLRDSSFN